MALNPVALTTIAALRLYLDRHRTEVSTGTLSDADLTVWINACSAAVEAHCDRWLAARTETVYVPFDGSLIDLSGPLCADGAYPVRSLTSLSLLHVGGTSDVIGQVDTATGGGWYANAHDLRMGFIHQRGVAAVATDVWALTGTFGLLPVTGGALDSGATSTEARDYATINQAVTLWCARRATQRIPGQQSLSLDQMRLQLDTSPIPDEVSFLLERYRRPSL